MRPLDAATVNVYDHALYARTADPGPHWYDIADRLRRPRPTPRTRRGAVTEFSARSRRRLQRTLAAVRWDAPAAPARFVTLTYRSVPDDWRSPWLAWLACVRRLGLHYMWRVELQRRGAPHWHVILWADADALAALKADWHRLAAPGDAAHARYGWHAEPVHSYRKAAAYVSKYVAKVRADEPELKGARRWGTSRALPLVPRSSVALEPPQYHTLARIARRLARARRRDRRPRARWWQYATWLYLDAASAARLLAWIAPDAPAAELADTCATAQAAGIVATSALRAPPPPDVARPARGDRAPIRSTQADTPRQLDIFARCASRGTDAHT